jgi:hypothetical protein
MLQLYLLLQHRNQKEQWITDNPLFYHNDWGICPSDTAPILFNIDEISAPTDSPQLSHHNHTTSVFLWNALLIWKGKCHYMQDLGCMVNEEEISIETAPGVALLWHWLLRVGTVMQEDHFLCEQAMVINLNGFLQVLQCCVVAVSIHWCPMCLRMQSTPHPCRLNSQLLFMVDVCFHSTDAALDVRVKW